MAIELTKTNFNKLNKIVEDEADLNKILAIIDKEAVRQAKMMIKADKKEAKQKALVLKKEANQRQKAIDKFKKQMEKYVNDEMSDEFSNIVITVSYPLATKFYLDNVEGIGFNRVREMKYNAIKDNESNEEVKEFVRVFKRMKIHKKYFMIKHLEETLTMDLEFAKDLKSKRANLVDEMIWDLVQ